MDPQAAFRALMACSREGGEGGEPGGRSAPEDALHPDLRALIRAEALAVNELCRHCWAALQAAEEGRVGAAQVSLVSRSGREQTIPALAWPAHVAHVGAMLPMHLYIFRCCGCLILLQVATSCRPEISYPLSASCRPSMCRLSFQDCLSASCRPSMCRQSFQDCLSDSCRPSMCRLSFQDCLSACCRPSICRRSSQDCLRFPLPLMTAACRVASCRRSGTPRPHPPLHACGVTCRPAS